ncbi:unnamed protein product [Paramecium sonneborni]|uniref:Uncharacterized protein n=1 Tax=Paramecium sonneborni TaxID=65129 RepID=A0A8S1M6F3_9CILI|nr:unnamed protein product [Paramecium sonneborni]
MIEIKEKGITSLELSKHLIKRLNFDVWKAIDRFELFEYIEKIDYILYAITYQAIFIIGKNSQRMIGNI